MIIVCFENILLLMDCARCGKKLGYMKFKGYLKFGITGDICKKCNDELYYEEHPELKRRLDKATKITNSKWWYLTFGLLLIIGLTLSLAMGRIPFT